MCELQKQSSKYILLEVSDVPKAALILERQFQTQDYAVQDERAIRLYDMSVDRGELNRALVTADVTVTGSQLCNDTLEDYFKRITGGEGIA